MRFDTRVDSGGDVRVVGPTNLPSVDCESFSTAGATNVEGDVTATDVSLEGTASVGGDVTAEAVVAKGGTEIGGDLDADEVTVRGTTSVGGDVRADVLEAKGSSEFRDVRADSASFAGTVSIADLVADAAEIRGVVSADRVEADEVQVVMADDESTVDAILGGTVVVERDEYDNDGRLTAGTIEGEAVTIEHATVEKVTGEEVRLGPGAHVEVVRATELNVDEAATVEQTEHLD